MLFVRINATKYYRSAMTQANSSFIHTKKLAARELIKDIYIKERHKVGIAYQYYTLKLVYL